MSIIPSDMTKPFEAAGWFEGRQIEVGNSVPTNHPAHNLLAEIGELRLVNPAPNIASIAFQHVAEGASIMAAWEAALGAKLIGIAEVDDGHAELYLSDHGQVVGCSLIHPACFLVGRTVQEALEAIGSGKRAQPMLLPHEEEITLFGITFRRGDTDVIGPNELA